VRAPIAGVGGEVHLAKPDEPNATSAIAVQAALGDLASEALERRTGVVLTIDELQLVRSEHATACGAALHARSARTGRSSSPAPAFP
jgi:hypothetical protein